MIVGLLRLAAVARSVTRELAYHSKRPTEEEEEEEPRDGFAISLLVEHQSSLVGAARTPFTE